MLSKHLASYNIEITPARLEVLSIITGMVDTEFTRTEIIEQVKKRNPSITHAVVGATLRLFKARKLIHEVNVYTIGEDIHGRKRGRPETKFIYRGNHSSEGNAPNELAEPFVEYSKWAA